jgi:hypothetical protein
VQSQPAPTTSGVLLVGESSSSTWRTFFKGMGTRTRIVQLCILAMCLALFILMRKFTHPND